MSPCSVWYISVLFREKNATAFLIVGGLLVTTKYSMSITLRESLVTFFSCPSNPANHGNCKYKYATQTMNRLF